MVSPAKPPALQLLCPHSEQENDSPYSQREERLCRKYKFSKEQTCDKMRVIAEFQKLGEFYGTMTTILMCREETAEYRWEVDQDVSDVRTAEMALR
jgi:hypothetical protein